MLAALAAGAALVLATRPGSGLFEPDEARQVLPLSGGGCLLAGLAAVLWAARIHRTRLIVTIGEKGVALRRGRRRAAVPAAAVEAMGIRWPVGDPVWTLWLDPEQAPGVETVAEVDGRAVTLLNSGSLPSGWLPAVRSAAADALGAAWRVVDDEGEEVPPPADGALARARHLVVDDRGRYRDRRGGTVLAVACRRRGSRTTVLRDPHAAALLVVRGPSRLPGRDRVRVLDAAGRPLGFVRGPREPSFHTAGGMLLGSTRATGDGHVVTGIDGRRSATLRIGGGDGGDAEARVELERSPSAPDPLRTLVLALPAALRAGAF
ncbi:hypothetical protein BJY14_008659 [Actinomadura luteofluorescens]|uniref:Uncharacterized protein n=1 Tax=Actinomadura luteofluorescens TaxID=46163 RepID=A0A7Y9ERU3_9ACTN|nr:hypothetical protein [Actinomadura luteofluorescens]NYD52676.1 hypothetical protein [Actinomadura luteofluorescens]